MPTILEVAVNGPWGRAKQPRIPIAVDEIVRDGVACARAGAAVVHVHPYDVATGRQRDELDIYLAIIDGIRSQSDALVYPTAPFIDDEGVDRYAVTAELARRGLIEWTTVDPGSLNVARFDEVEAGGEGFVYRNPIPMVRAGLQVAQQYGVRPSYACYEPGMVRLGAALYSQYSGMPSPVYRLMFSDEFTFGFPPTETAFRAYAELLSSVAPNAPVMVAGLGVNIHGSIASAVARGWHVRVGLEDAPFGAIQTNEELVVAAASAVRLAGGRLATPSDVRTRLEAGCGGFSGATDSGDSRHGS
jgi:uncharacterized protein (DUF849 family)